MLLYCVFIVCVYRKPCLWGTFSLQENKNWIKLNWNVLLQRPAQFVRRQLEQTFLCEGLFRSDFLIIQTYSRLHGANHQLRVFGAWKGKEKSMVDNAHLLNQRFILGRCCLGEPATRCEQKRATLSVRQALRSCSITQSSMGSPLGVQMAVARPWWK